MFKQIVEKNKEIYKNTDSATSLHKSACSKGCSFCCHQIVEIAASEELNIIEYLNTNVDVVTKNIIRINLENWLFYFLKNTPNKVTLKDRPVIQFKLAKDKIPCPFLINSSCSIYPARPLICRTHSVKDDPEKCNTDPLRNSMPETSNIGNFMIKEILRAAPNNFIRILPYALIDFFNLKIKLKEVESIGFRN